MHPEHPVEESTSVLWRAFGRLTHGVVGVSFLLALGLPASTALARGVDEVARQAAASEDGAPFSPADDQGRFVHLIDFAEPGVLHRVERAPRERFDARSPEARARLEQVMAEQAAHVQRMAAALGRNLDVTHHYTMTHSGLATRLTLEEAQALRGLPGVVSVERERLYELTTYRGPAFIGADSIWDGSAVPDNMGTRGEEMVIAVLDTGVDPTHPSFANDAACGHGGGNDDKLLSFLDCATTDGGGLCNGPSPTDLDGHGSHTASTAGGNTLDGTAVPPPSPPPGFDEISGVAPCARVRTYKVCPAQCPGAQIQAGMTSVLLHGDVDAMNFSISGGTSPWNDNDRRKLDLVDAGVFVAASAGNTSAGVPNPVGNVNHRGPWVLSVAASTHDGVSGLLSASGPGVPPGNLQDIAMVRGSDSPIADPLTDFPIRHFTGQPAAFEGCTAGEDGAPGDLVPFPPGFFDGAAALIHRGTCPFTKKITNAFNAGAEMVIIRNNVAASINMSTPGQPNIPAYSIDQIPGNNLVAFVDANPATATIDTEAKGDFLAGFSFRGPTPAPLQDLTKPDITGPGVSILAAVPVALGGYGNISGTSMSSPHLAGAATLVRAVQPAWTVSEVKSAMMMTAFKGGTKENGATPWDADDVGNGRADLTRAALAGLVMDETTANYLAANPATGGDVKTLNIPAVRNVDCSPSCSWTRTVRNTLETVTSWTAAGVNITPGFEITVEPSSFTFGGGLGETQVLTITATPEQDLTASVAFGEVVLSETGGESPDLHMTVAIRGEPEGAEEPIANISPSSFDFTVPAGGDDTQTLDVGNIGDADLVWIISEADDTLAPRGGGGDWSDDFDSYATGSQIHGQGGWKGWFNDPSAGALVSDTEANSTPNSLAIVGDSDVVREFTGINSGQWTVTAWQFVPSDFSGESFFIQLNNYNDANVGLNWSTQVRFVGGTNMVVNDGNSAGTLPLIRNEWVELRVEIDLDSNTQEFFYGGQLLYSGTWTNEVSGGGSLVFDTIDLFANGASAIYYDDLSLTAGISGGPCASPVDISWLSASPNAGTTGPASSVPVDVAVDTTGLEVGDHSALLCVTTNDPNASLVEIPVSLTVIPGGPAPIIDVDPTSLSSSLQTGQMETQQLTVANLGDETLEWEVTEDGGGLAGRPFAGGASTRFGASSRTSSTEASEEAAKRRLGTATDSALGAGRDEDGARSWTDPGLIPGDQDRTVSNDFVNVGSLTFYGNRGDFQASNPSLPLEDFSDTNVPPNDVVSCAPPFNSDTNNACFSPGDILPGLSMDVTIGEGGGEAVVLTPPVFGVPCVSVGPGSFADHADWDFDPPVKAAGFDLQSNVAGQVFAVTVFGPGGELGSTNVTASGLGTPVFFGVDTSDDQGISRIEVRGPGAQGELFCNVEFGGDLGPADCTLPDWLSVDPTSGSVSGGGSQLANVTFDTAGLPTGDFSANLCLASNDPFNPLVVVPVSLTVGDPAPVADISPESFELVVQEGGSAAEILNVGNLGLLELTWSITTDVPTGGPIAPADFEGPFDIENWTFENDPPGTGGSFDTNPGPPIELFITGGDNDVEGNSDFSIEIPQNGTITFDWGYQSTDSGNFDNGGFVVNGVYTVLANNDSQVEFFEGSTTVPVSAGDIFAFRVHTQDGEFGPGVLGITSFEFEVAICADVTEVDWLSVDPTAGTTAPESTEPVDVLVDTTGLPLGTFEAVLCVETNDPKASLVPVPVTLNVVEFVPEPELSFDPPELDFGNVDVGETSPQQSSTLSNTGEAAATELTFSLSGSLGFDVDTTTCGATLPAGGSCPVMVTFTPTEAGPAAATLEASSAEGASASLALSGNGVGEGGFTAMALEVDPEVLFSDGNRVFEPGEVVVVAPSWRNDEPTPQDVTGSADDFTGPDGAVYTLVVPDADYGVLDPGETASCLDVGPDVASCYQMGVDDPALRPATHWDATFEETLFDGTGKTWTLHIGDSFRDVARASGFYRFIETLLHHQVTGGCTETEYCPGAVNTRAQMPVFVLRALEGPDFSPPGCVPGEESFADVPATNGFCPWIEELALRNVVAGCGNDNYCPDDPINRQQMAVFLLRTFGGPTFTPPECSGIFDDVACPSPFADWVEELFNRDITGGCSDDPMLYCPVDSVNRQQMAVFVSQTFGLQLYGP